MIFMASAACSDSGMGSTARRSDTGPARNKPSRTRGNLRIVRRHLTVRLMEVNPRRRRDSVPLPVFFPLGFVGEDPAVVVLLGEGAGGGFVYAATERAA